jgi:hypothetical protein
MKRIHSFSASRIVSSERTDVLLQMDGAICIGPPQEFDRASQVLKSHNFVTVHYG